MIASSRKLVNTNVYFFHHSPFLGETEHFQWLSSKLLLLPISNLRNLTITSAWGPINTASYFEWWLHYEQKLTAACSAQHMIVWRSAESMNQKCRDYPTSTKFCIRQTPKFGALIIQVQLLVLYTILSRAHDWTHAVESIFPRHATHRQNMQSIDIEVAPSQLIFWTFFDRHSAPGWNVSSVLISHTWSASFPTAPLRASQ